MEHNAAASVAVEETPGRSPPSIVRVAVIGGADVHAFHGGGGSSGKSPVVYGKAAGKLDVVGASASTAATAAASTGTAVATKPTATEGGRGAFSDGEGFGDGARVGDHRRGSRKISPEPSAGLMVSMRQLSVLIAMVGLVAVAFDYEHGMAGFHWFHHWVRHVDYCVLRVFFSRGIARNTPQ